MPKKTIPIMADADMERLAELDAAVKIAVANVRAAESEPRRFGDALPDQAAVQEAQAAFDAFLDEASKRGESWELSSIGHEEFRNLLREHPPRMVEKTAEDGTVTSEPDPIDDLWGVNTETFPKALLLFSDVDDAEIRTITELKVGRKNIAGDQLALLKRFKRLSQGQFEKLWTEAYALNKQGVTDPKLARFSSATPRSTET